MQYNYVERGLDLIIIFVLYSLLGRYAFPRLRVVGETLSLVNNHGVVLDNRYVPTLC